MTAKCFKRTALLLPIALLILCAAAVLTFAPEEEMKVYGNLSSRDIAEIQMLHRNNCSSRLGPAWYRRLCPLKIRRFVAAYLDPIDVISVQPDGSALIVYRGWDKKYYDSRGEHRWGDASYKLVREADGWGYAPPSFSF